MKLSLCLIVKNEEKTLPKLFKSVEGIFDEVVVVDTGSTDKTKKVCKDSLGEKLVWSEFNWVEDFSVARQKSFEFATGDWIVWADADDIIKNAGELRPLAEKCDKDGINAVVFPYHYSIDEEGNTTVLQMRERLIKNNGYYKWIGRLHETLVPVNKMALAVSLTSVEWFHNTTKERVQESKERNVRILEAALDHEVEIDKVDPRTVYNLGNAYFTVDMYKEAAGCYLKYIPMSGWVEERYLARHRASLGFLFMQDADRAKEMAFTAIEEKPEYADAYIDLGKIYFEKKDFTKALHWFLEASKKGLPEKLPVYNPMDYSANLSMLIGHCYVQLSEFRKAKPYFENFKQFYPKSEHADKVLKIIADAIKEADLVHSITLVGRELQTKDFWRSLPEKFLEYPEILHEKNKMVDRLVSAGKDIAIYCGNCIVPWDANSALTGGIGGSEEAVINITKRLVKMGWNVTVYGRPNTIGLQDGVDYRHYTDFNPNDAWDIFISWRMPSVFAVEINAKKKYCWLHDCTPEEAFGPEILKNIDKIIVLSRYHRSLYPQIPEDKFFYSGNGLDPSHFFLATKKDPAHCLYTSSPDRGLECLLNMWPKIREQVPEATLSWFYGWDVFDKLHKDNEEMQEYKKKMKKLLDQPGVFEGGRIDHNAIAEEYQKARLWLYPTEFTETFCISAAKAQAAGAIPVTTTVAALDETVQYGVKLDVKDLYTNEVAQQKYIDYVVEYLKDPELAEAENCGMESWACEYFDWQNVAEQWDNEFTGILI